jgi:hypothetical protein
MVHRRTPSLLYNHQLVEFRLVIKTKAEVYFYRGVTRPSSEILNIVDSRHGRRNHGVVGGGNL